MKKYFKLIRIKHWLKNGLIILPIFFSGNLFNKKYYLNTLLAILIFCFISSIVYILNDIQDIEKDKLHAEKKKRPLASGEITVKMAYIISLFLTVLSFIMTILLYRSINNIFSIIIPIAYIGLNILYSKYLKNIPIIDVVILVSGFVLRVMYGGISNQLGVSKYLYLMIIFGSFYLGFGKRRNEIIKNGINSRKVLESYNKDFLDKNMYVALTLAIVSYSLWCVDPTTIFRIGNDKLFWTIPLLMIILQKYSLIIEGDSHGDPIEVILSDKVLIGTILIYALIMLFLLYIT